MDRDQLELSLRKLASSDHGASEELLRSELNKARVSIDELLASLSDESLASLIKKDRFRKPAFEELLSRRYERQMYAWFLRFCENEHVAEELTMEVQLRLYRNGLATFSPERSFRGYLVGCCRNLFLSEVRRSQAHPSFPLLVDPPDSHDPLQDVEVAELREQFDHALHKLPPFDQDVMRLQLEGNGPGEIARQLGVKTTRIYQSLHQARTILASRLGIVRPSSNQGRKPRRAGNDRPDSPQAEEGRA